MLREDAVTRRDLLARSARLAAAGTLAGTLAASRAAPAAVGAAGRTRVYLLGSQGGQQRTRLTGANVRGGTSALVVVDGVGYLIDAGVGALLRLNQAGLDANAVRHAFVTHHHQDHTADLGSVIGFSWSSGRNGSRERRRFDLWGPPGTKAFAEGYRIANALSIADQEGPLAQYPRFGDFLHVHELALAGRIRTRGVRVLRDGRVSVRAIRVNHGELPSLGYRLRTPDLDVAFSGDRGDRGDRFARFARGADVLFHEIIDLDLVLPVLRGQGAARSFLERLRHDHSDPELVGRTATAARVPKLVLYHLIPGTPAVSDATWRRLVAPHYSGEIVVGTDLLEL